MVQFWSTLCPARSNSTQARSRQGKTPSASGEPLPHSAQSWARSANIWRRATVGWGNVRSRSGRRPGASNSGFPSSVSGWGPNGSNPSLLAPLSPHNPRCGGVASLWPTAISTDEGRCCSRSTCTPSSCTGVVPERRFANEARKAVELGPRTSRRAVAQEARLPLGPSRRAGRHESKRPMLIFSTIVWLPNMVAR